MAFEQSVDYAAKSSLISQVQDLFAEYGEGFLEACLTYNDDDPERVIAALCEQGQLPPELNNLDRKLS